jgi:hypothetical protein
MPPKKQRIGRPASRAALAKGQREHETSEEREKRLEANRARMAATRSVETSDQRQLRQNANRAQMAVARSMETPDQRQGRQAANRAQMERARKVAYKDLAQSGFHYRPSIDYSAYDVVNIGSLTKLCLNCQALKFSGEPPGLCCKSGKIKLEPMPNPIEPMKTLLIGQTPESKHFLDNIKLYNSCFQMTSFGVDKDATLPGWQSTFRVQGQVYHRIGSLLPMPNENAKFLQIYFMDNFHEQAQQRAGLFKGLKEQLILDLQEMLHQQNPYVRDFKMALEKMTDSNVRVIIHADKKPQGEHSRRFNAPSAKEIAVLMSGQEFGKRDIVLSQRDASFKRVSETHRSYDALQYPLLFFQGTDGYNFSIMQINPTTGLPSQKKVSAQDFYAFRMMIRSQNFNYLLRCKQLLNMFIVDMYAKIETERLNYIKHHQKQLRAEEYIDLRDHVANDGDITNVGQLVILPSSFTGGPRYMHERTQDAMTFVRNFGRPDLFITFTCNPKWPDIQQNLMDGQTAADRHDLVARVFKLKADKLMDLVRKGQIFGEVRCHMLTFEWQKRGLPHVHILLWLRNKIHANMIDSLISAELPNPQEDPGLFEIVKSQMMHGPCGRANPNSPCMQNGQCTKNYPKKFLQNTQTDQDGYPLYRRRSPQDGGISFVVKRGNTQIEVDNTWVVPYNKLLSKAFNAHINVEFCNSVKAIKYVTKYINKGSDQAVFALHQSVNSRDEVSKFQNGRYISSNEAAWRIFSFPIHDRYPPVCHLQVHLENRQRVYFNTDNIQERATTAKDTTLTAFFKLCHSDDFARTLYYPQLPKFYTWNPSTAIFKRRAIGAAVEGHPGIKASDALGRVYTVHPNNQECYFLRLLLHHVRGPTSFDHLKTVNGVVLPSFREACSQLGLLENDEHWDWCLEEAAARQLPSQMRQLFAIMIATCGLGNPLELWQKHKESLCEDFMFQQNMQQICPQIENQALIMLEDKVLDLCQKTLLQFGLPAPNRAMAQNINRELQRETSYNRTQLSHYVRENEPKLNPDQKVAYNAVLASCLRNEGQLFFLDAPGGTGKTFVINLILAKMRSERKVALAVASSGIAATLLEGGRTAHSMFKLPLNLAKSENPICNIKRNSNIAKVLQECHLIIWDECTMAHKKCFEALDKTLRDLRQNRIMGKVTVLFAGDFRQTLPIIQKGTPADELDACLKQSYLWRDVKSLRLSTNMRVRLSGDPTAGRFGALLLKIGGGHVPQTAEGIITIPEGMGTWVNTSAELKEKVYPNLVQHWQDSTWPTWLSKRAILAPRNDTVDQINSQLMEVIPGQARTYKSIDNVVEQERAVEFPAEFLNSLQPPGMPPHNLKLKKGAPIMLLRNLDPPKLCNGTRLIVKSMLPYLLEAIIITGQFKGESVFIPRIPIIATDLAFEFKRLQFPVRACFAMSINKAQGQSLQVAGLHLLQPCFSHGQLYVGCSRVGTAKALYLLAPDGKTKNIVYPAALQ